MRLNKKVTRKVVSVVAVTMGLGILIYARFWFETGMVCLVGVGIFLAELRNGPIS